MDGRPSRAVVGFTGFACIVLILTGIFEAFAGLTGILEDEIYGDPRNYLFDLGVFGWGIVHMALGIVLVAAGFMLVLGAVWARAIGVILAAISATVNFLSIPYYPAWSILVLALNIGVIWALTVHGREIMGEERPS